MPGQILPNEIYIYILKIRNNIRYRASKKIQNAWRKYILPEEIAKYLAMQIKLINMTKLWYL
tara:strand:+ start:233 stop:418 length:186 start_codon:yes stop_codon:yes gene_type:complete